MKKIRADELTVQQGLAADRTEAKRFIMAGLILNREQRIDKPGEMLKADAQLRRKVAQKRFVSRGGDKLADALVRTGLQVVGLTVIDLGASTGGFTDCLLQMGAAHVFAVDVGTNQLDFRLRQDPRIAVFERTHAKALTNEMIDLWVDVVVADVSFTSLKQVLPPVFPFLKQSAALLVLFKPQFELPREAVDQGGIVTDQIAVKEALDDMHGWFASMSFEVRDCFKSSVKGREGNQEYFFWCVRA